MIYEECKKKSAVFDSKKFSWVSSQYLLKQDLNSILKIIRSLDSNWGVDKEDNFCLKVIELMKPRSDSIQDIMINSHYFYDIPNRYEPNDHKKVWKDNTEAILKDIIVLYESSEIQNSQHLEKLFKSFIQTTGFRFGQVMKPMRLALCGSLTGPSLFELMELLGVEESLNRISTYINRNKNE